MIDRCIPLVTAAYGTRVARPARMTMPAPGNDGSQLDQRGRSVLGDRRLVAKSAQGSRQRGWGDWNSGPPPESVAWWQLRWRCDLPSLVTRGDHYLVGKSPEGLAAAEWEDLNSAPPP